MKIFGAGGHGKVIAEIAESCFPGGPLSFIDDRQCERFFGYNVNTKQSLTDNEDLFIALGSNYLRKQISIEFQHLQFVRLIHPSCQVSPSSNIGLGTVCMPGVSINAEAKIGDHCIINTNSSIDHDCIIEDYVHISPNAAIAGNVYIGEGTHVGIGSSIIQGVKIGRWATIGAGASIINDIPDFAVVVGVPGKIIKYNEHNGR